MSNRLMAVSLVGVFMVSGCAHIDFDTEGKGLAYYEPKPYLFVSTTKECVSTATVVIIPGTMKRMKFASGYGTSDLSVKLVNGMVTEIGQKTDTKIPETITAISGLVKTAADVKGIKEPDKPTSCTAESHLYPIENGIPDGTKPISFAVHK